MIVQRRAGVCSLGLPGVMLSQDAAQMKSLTLGRASPGRKVPARNEETDGNGTNPGQPRLKLILFTCRCLSIKKQSN